MFNPLSAIIVSDLIAGGVLPENPTAVDMGNQTYGVHRHTLERIIAKLRKAPGSRTYRIDYRKLESFLGAEPKTPNVPTVEEFYRALGFRSYEAIDINSRYGSQIMDLNKDLASHYGFKKRYDLVINTGTSEHIFNQATFFKNGHDLAEAKGYMVHIVPFTGYINHGFYNYQPNTFYDLCFANSYTFRSLYLADRDDVLLDFQEPDGIAANFLPFVALGTRNPKGNTFLVAILQKPSLEEFVLPCQGKYVAALEGDQVKASYTPQVEANPARSMPGLAAEARKGFGSRIKKKLKRSLLKSLRRLSRFVLLRL